MAQQIAESDKYSSLLEIDLSGLKLSKLPVWIVESNKLVRLDFAGNNLAQLPEWLCNLSQLTALNVSHNNFVALPGVSGEIRLLKRLIIN